MKIVISVLALLTGVFMLLDGITVMLRGKYIGPPEPGPWAKLFRAFGVNVFSLGPLFVTYGIAWLILLFAVTTNQSWALRYGLFLAILTLWYLPVGTLFSIIVLILLFLMRR